jgi:hypothetical protein
MKFIEAICMSAIHGGLWNLTSVLVKAEPDSLVGAVIGYELEGRCSSPDIGTIFTFSISSRPTVDSLHSLFSGYRF